MWRKHFFLSFSGLPGPSFSLPDDTFYCISLFLQCLRALSRKFFQKSSFLSQTWMKTESRRKFFIKSICRNTIVIIVKSCLVIPRSISFNGQIHSNFSHFLFYLFTFLLKLLLESQTHLLWFILSWFEQMRQTIFLLYFFASNIYKELTTYASDCYAVTSSFWCSLTIFLFCCILLFFIEELFN